VAVQEALSVPDGHQTADIPVPEYDEKRLDCEFDRLQRRLPGPIGRSLRWLRAPSARWVRWPIAILFILGGLVGFLPILGFWMVPVGLMLLAQDVSFLRPPLLRVIVWVRRRWSAASQRRYKR
jgi:hypothetical protein